MSKHGLIDKHGALNYDARMTKAGLARFEPILKVLKTDPAEAETKFNALDTVSQVELFLNADDMSRLRLLEISHDPRGFMKELPATEIWMTVKRLGKDDALPLINYASPEQTQVMIDIETWKKDRILIPDLYEWLGYIYACGNEKIMEYFSECDWDEILFFFKSAIVAYKKVDKDEDVTNEIAWPREEMPTTHEGVYYFQVIHEEWDQMLRQLLEILVKHDHNAYMKILEACMWDVPSQREEEAYEVRSRRLAEHGFPTFDEAVTINSPLPKSKLGFAIKRPATNKIEKYFAPRYPLIVMGERVLFLNRVVSVMSEQEESRLLIELANIANKILISEGKEVGADTIKASMEKAIDVTSKGLESLSNGNIDRGRELLNEYWTQTIYQVGLATT